MVNKYRMNRVKFLRAFQSLLITNEEYCLVEKWIIYKIYKAFQNDKDNYSSISKDNPKMISYAKSPDNKYSPSGRIKTRFGRYVRKALGFNNTSDVPDLLLNKIGADILVSMSPKDLEIKIHKGNDFENIYREGFGGHTCMTNDSARYMNILRDNPKNVGVATLSYPQNARALIWTTDDGETVLDRIYPNDGAHIQLFHKWAKKNKILYRDGQSCEFTTPVSDKKTHVITIRNNSSRYPYFDTFYYGRLHEKGNKLSLCNYPKDTHNNIYNMTFGSTDGIYGTAGVCFSCGILRHDSTKGFTRLPNHPHKDNYVCQQCKIKMFACNCCGNVFDKNLLSVFIPKHPNFLYKGFNNYNTKNPFKICSMCPPDIFYCKTCEVILPKTGTRNLYETNHLLITRICRKCSSEVEVHQGEIYEGSGKKLNLTIDSKDIYKCKNCHISVLDWTYIGDKNEYYCSENRCQRVGKRNRTKPIVRGTKFSASWSTPKPITTPSLKVKKIKEIVSNELS